MKAREKWCPMVRYGEVRYPEAAQMATNRDGANSSIPDYALCVTDLCMMWRVDGNFKGYCGLAGRLGGHE